MVLQTPQQVLRQCDRQVRKRAALLVGNGLTAAAKMKSPTVGNGAETGERVAKLRALASNVWRVRAAPYSSFVKALQEWLSLAHHQQL